MYVWCLIQTKYVQYLFSVFVSMLRVQRFEIQTKLIFRLPNDNLVPKIYKCVWAGAAPIRIRNCFCLFSIYEWWRCVVLRISNAAGIMWSNYFCVWYICMYNKYVNGLSPILVCSITHEKKKKKIKSSNVLEPAINCLLIYSSIFCFDGSLKRFNAQRQQVFCK